MQVIERVSGRYDVQEVKFGKVYRWRPGCVVVDCDYCGGRSALTGSTTTCSCGADYEADISREPVVRRPVDEDARPWRTRSFSEDGGIPF